MIDELRQIAVFSKVVEHGSLRKAAAALDISPSVVSHHVSQLETKLGVALLYRSTRKLTLTREGEVLLGAARQMMEAVETGLDQVTGKSTEPTGELSVTIPSVLVHSPITKAIARFHQNFPKIRLDIDYTDERKPLIENRIDVAIRMTLNRERSPNRKTILKAQRYIVAARTYMEAREPIEHPSQLLDLDWIDLKPVRQNRLVLTKDGEDDVSLSPHASIQANSAIGRYYLARASSGVAVVPGFVARHDLADGRVVQLCEDWQIEPLEVFAEWHSNTPRQSITQLFVNQISESLAFHNKAGGL